MAKLGFGGYEWNDAGGPLAGADLETTVTSPISYDSVVKRTGSFSCKCNSGAGNVAAATTTANNAGVVVTASSTVYGCAYFRFSDLPALTVSIFKQLVVSGAEIRLTSGGVIQLWNNVANTQIGSNGPTLNTSGTWYRIEMSVTLDASGIATAAEGRVDGTSFASGSGLSGGGNFSGNVFALGWNDAPGANKVVNIDDTGLNDSTGATFNSWVGDHGVVLLIPTADSAKGTGWTNDAATTTNLFDAVNNLPPVGIADTTASTGLHQLRNATANANSSYDATLTSYTAAGVPAGATVNAVLPFCVTGAPSGTSPKAGTFGVVSNPAIANIALNASISAGNFYAGAIAGTYGTGWKGSFGTATFSPSVVLGTAPVLRVTQVTSSTRIAMVAFMCMLVDYTPAVAATKAPPFQPRTVRNSLLRR